jgi:spore germination protein YaaH
MRYMTWSDSGAIAQKVALAKRLGIRGVAIFKLDGGEDQAMWNVLPVQR